MKKSEESRSIAESEFHGSTLSFESGWVAKQADGAVIVRAGDSMVLCTVCRADPREGQNFFPLVVDYQERAYAAGKIPGGFFKREGRPGEHEILTCRLIDRPIRPLFPDGYMDEVQIICSVISSDPNNDPNILAISGASAALHISNIPFLGPIAGVRVGRIDGKLVINPGREERTKSDIDLIVAGTKDAIVMVEGGAQVVPEPEVLDALFFGHEELKKIIALQEQLRKNVGRPKMEFVAPETDKALLAKIDAIVGGRIEQAIVVPIKHERQEALSQIGKDVKTALAEEFPDRGGEISNIVHDKIKQASRDYTVGQGKRIDQRAYNKVRDIECEVGLIPRAHGSALFTRGETQAFVATTLGTSVDAQRIDSISAGESEKTFLLHYNFPPYCTGEVKMLRGTGRREIGHGMLAERALRSVLPDAKDFPYVVRLVSDVTESNGSSSMASVCGGSMSMMEAGVPLKDSVAGVAMGLIKEGDKVVVLTDILGDEDHFGDMDFKVCGTKNGISALQMDIKCTGLSRATMEQALQQAREGRLHILGEMAKVIDKPRTEMSRYAPTIETMKINPDKIRDVIGPGGKTIRSITETTGVKIDIDDDGTIHIASPDGEANRRAREIIAGLTEEAEIGRIYCGVVKRVVDFGAFVEILPGVEGLVHISQLDHQRVREVSDVVNEGDEVSVRVLDIDRQGRIRLSRKEAMEAEQ